MTGEDLSNVKPHFAMSEATLECGHCGAHLGAAILQRGRLLVSDREGRRVRMTETAQGHIEAAKALAHHFAHASQEAAREGGPGAAFAPTADVVSTGSATRAALDRLNDLQGGSAVATYELQCACGSNPRITGERLSSEMSAGPHTKVVLR